MGLAHLQNGCDHLLHMQGGSSDYREAVVTAMKSPLKDFCGCMTNRDTVESEATLCEDFTAAQGENKISNKFMLAGQDVVTIS